MGKTPSTISQSEYRKQIAKELDMKPADVKRFEEAQTKVAAKNVKAGKAVRVLDGIKILPQQKKAQKGGITKMGPQGEYVTKARPARTVVKARAGGGWRKLFGR